MWCIAAKMAGMGCLCQRSKPVAKTKQRNAVEIAPNIPFVWRVQARFQPRFLFLAAPAQTRLQSYNLYCYCLFER